MQLDLYKYMNCQGIWTLASEYIIWTTETQNTNTNKVTALTDISPLTYLPDCISWGNASCS